MTEATESKTCRRCQRHRPLPDYARNATAPDGLRSECRECRSQADRRYLLARRFGIGPESYDAMLAAQGGRCALCVRDRPSGRWPRFHVDHCHDTGRVRGLLCHRCNVALGVLGDNTEGLRRALAYVAGESGWKR